MHSVEYLKRIACREALSYIRDGQVVGLGSGTTMRMFIQMLSNRIKNEGLNVIAIPTSSDVEILVQEMGIASATLNEYPSPDIAVDGADCVGPDLNLIKGGGGALTREKIVDYSAGKYIIVVDETKVRNNVFSVPVPIEVLPFAWRRVMVELRSLVNSSSLRTSTRGRLGPVITDNGNYIIDAEVIDTGTPPEEVEIALKRIPGVVENGIFAVKKPSIVVVGTQQGVKMLSRR